MELLKPKPINNKLYSYFKNVFTKEQGKRLYNALIKMVDPIPKKRIIYDKEGTEHRLNKWFSVLVYVDNKPIMNHDLWPPELREIVDHVKKVTGHTYDSALVNYYRNGFDHIGAHRDRETLEGYIASVSFGATRDFVIRDGETKKKLFTVPLYDCSLFEMKPGFQQKYLHELPKRARVLTGRVNITLRQQRKQIFDPSPQINPKKNVDESKTVLLQLKKIAKNNNKLNKILDNHFRLLIILDSQIDE